MSQGSQQAITHVLQQDSKVLGTLLHKLGHLAKLNQILAENVDKKLAPYCQVANYANEVLTVITPNAIWATQIRFLLPILLTKLQQHPEFSQIKNIICKISPQNAPYLSPEPPVIRTMPKLSAATAKMVLDTASMIKHEKLQTILQRIATHHKEKT